MGPAEAPDRNSQTTSYLVSDTRWFPLVAGSGFVFEDTGEHELKSVPDRLQLYRVVPEEPDQARE